MIAGTEWVPTAEVCERLGPDVGPETLRNWYAPRGGARPVVRVLRGPAGRAVRGGRTGREYLLAWDDVVEAEHRYRSAAAGRPRRGMSANACTA